MKFLIDAQLPPRLAGWLGARGHEAQHVVELPGGLEMRDAGIWDHATRGALVIVTKDKDFLDLAAVRGTPPIVLLLSVGNASNVLLLQLLDAAWPVLSAELERADVGVVVLERDRVAVLRRP